MAVFVMSNVIQPQTFEFLTYTFALYSTFIAGESDSPCFLPLQVNSVLYYTWGAVSFARAALTQNLHLSLSV